VAAPPQTAPDIQKINVKISLASAVDADRLLPVFGRWRLEEGEEIVDLADYCHVPEGPGVLLVSKRWHFGIDFADWPGLFYSSRAASSDPAQRLSGDLESRVSSVFRACVEKSVKLLAEPELADVSAACDKIEIIFNDRLLMPNDAPTAALAEPAVRALCDEVWGAGESELRHDENPGHRLGWTAASTGDEKVDLDSLAAKS